MCHNWKATTALYISKVDILSDTCSNSSTGGKIKRTINRGRGAASHPCRACCPTDRACSSFLHTITTVPCWAVPSSEPSIWLRCRWEQIAVPLPPWWSARFSSSTLSSFWTVPSLSSPSAIHSHESPIYYISTDHLQHLFSIMWHTLSSEACTWWRELRGLGARKKLPVLFLSIFRKKRKVRMESSIILTKSAARIGKSV